MLMTLLGILVGLVITMVVIVVGSPLWVYLLARFDILYTFIKEGRGVIIKRGDQFFRAMIKWEGHDIIDSEEKLVAHQGARPGEPVEMWDIIPTGIVPLTPLSWLEHFTGARWIGLPPWFSVYWYKFERTTLEPTGAVDANGHPILRPTFSDEETKWVFLADTVYWGKVEGAETRQKVPVDVEFLETMRVTNPWRALFGVTQWLDAVIKLSVQRGRQYLGTRTYEQLVRGENATPEKGFSGGLTILREEVHESYGTFIVRVDIYSITLAGSVAADYEKASTAEFTASAKAKTTTIQGKAEAKVIEVTGEARKKALNAQILAYKESPEAAKDLLTAEVGRGLGLGPIVRTIAESIRKGLSS